MKIESYTPRYVSSNLAENKLVKMTLRSADSPRRPLSGHLTDIHISFGTFQRHSHYSQITLAVHTGTCNS